MAKMYHLEEKKIQTLRDGIADFGWELVIKRGVTFSPNTRFKVHVYTFTKSSSAAFNFGSLL